MPYESYLAQRQLTTSLFGFFIYLVRAFSGPTLVNDPLLDSGPRYVKPNMLYNNDVTRTNDEMI